MSDASEDNESEPVIAFNPDGASGNPGSDGEENNGNFSEEPNNEEVSEIPSDEENLA